MQAISPHTQEILPNMRKLPEIFDLDIVNQFSSEASGSYTPDLAGANREFIFRVRQYADLIAALNYAEKEILPHLQLTNFGNMSHGILVEWIKRLHGHAAATLVKPQELSSGEFIQRPVLRWEKTASFYRELLSALVKNLPLEPVLKRYQLDNEDGRVFIQLINRLKTSNIAVPPNYLQKPFFGENEKNVLIVLTRIVVAKHSKLLSLQEETSLAKIVKVCMLPDNVPSAMEQFATQLLTKMQCCANDIDSVAALAAYAYRELTEIHPFANGNGRVSMILLNCILLAFGYSSIVFRTAADKTNEESQYNKVIQQIDSKPELLTEYIKGKILAARGTKPTRTLISDLTDKLGTLEHLGKLQKLLNHTSYPSEKIFFLCLLKRIDLESLSRLNDLEVVAPPTDISDSIKSLCCNLPPHVAISVLKCLKQIPHIGAPEVDKDHLDYTSQTHDDALDKAIYDSQLKFVYSSVGQQLEPDGIGPNKKLIRALCVTTSSLFKEDPHTKLKNSVSQHISKHPRAKVVLEAITAKDYNQALRRAAAIGSAELIDLITQYQYQLPIDINAAAGTAKNTALHWAAERGHMEAVETLLKQGADTDIKNSALLCPMESANAAGQHAVAQEIAYFSFIRSVGSCQ